MPSGTADTAVTAIFTAARCLWYGGNCEQIAKNIKSSNKKYRPNHRSHDNIWQQTDMRNSIKKMKIAMPLKWLKDPSYKTL